MKYALLTVILVLVLSSCSTNVENEEIDNTVNLSPTISNVKIKTEDDDVLAVLLTNTMYGIFEFNNCDFTKIDFLVTIYAEGELIENVYYDGVHKYNEPLNSGKIAVKILNDNDIELIINNDGENRSRSLPENFIETPKDCLGMMSFIEFADLAIEEGSEIPIFVFVCSEESTFPNLNLNQYSDEELAQSKYCYIIKCIFN